MQEAPSGYVLLKQQEYDALLLRIKELESLVQQLSQKKNSRNSHQPPSADLTRKNQSLREKTSRKPGGQKGHKGATLHMSDTPDEIHQLSPDYCNQCGRDLSAIEGQFEDRRQVVNIPPIRAQYIEYQRYSKQCLCSHRQQADYPANVTNHIQYGPEIAALVGYFSVYQYVPYQRLSRLFTDCFQLPLSEGSISNMLERLAGKALPVYNAIKQTLLSSMQVGADETGIKVNGEKRWVWTWQNRLTTWMTASANRGWDTVAALFPDGFTNAVLNSDRWAAQLKTTARAHQLCMAHLLRDLNYLEELEKSQWAAQLKTLFQKAINLNHKSDCYSKDDPQMVELEYQLDNLLAESLPEKAMPKTIVFLNAMKKHRDALLVFLYEPEVPPDNNASERAIRNLKVKQKVSGQFKTRANDFCILRSVVDTCIKRNVQVIDAFRLIAKTQAACG